MTYTTPRSCFICGTPWSGYGVTCNACKTIDAIKDQSSSNSSLTTSDNNSTSIVLIIGILLLVDYYKFNFAICKFTWLLLKVGFYLMFGWWMGIEVF